MEPGLPMKPELEIVAINRQRRIALCKNMYQCRITDLFDSNGEETDDPDEAIAAVVHLPDDTWTCILFEEFAPINMN